MSLRLVKCLTLSLLIAAAFADPALADWEDDLAEQIERKHDCKVAFLSRIIERTVEGHKVVRAMVHCNDERRFDAFRPDQSDLFQFIETANSDATLLSLRRRLGANFPLNCSSLMKSALPPLTDILAHNVRHSLQAVRRSEVESIADFATAASPLASLIDDQRFTGRMQ